MSTSQARKLRTKRIKIEEGMQFGHLTALFRVDRSNWAFLCSCGTTHVAKAAHVVRPNGTKSCGCHRSNLNGLHDSPEHMQWRHSYSEKWPEFMDFWLELGPRPDPSMHVTAIDPMKPIGPRNAMWACGQTLFGNLEIETFEDLDEMVTNNKSIAAIHQAAYEAQKDPSTFEWHLNRIEAEHKPEEDLEAQQHKLENESLEYSSNQWVRRQDTLEQKGRMSQAAIGKEFLRKLIPILALRIKENCDEAQRRLRAGGAAKHGSSHHQLIPMVRDFVDDHSIAYITIACVMDSIGRGATAKTPMSKVLTTVGERLDHQLFLQKFKDADPSEFQSAEKRFLKDETRTYNRKLTAMKRAAADVSTYEPLSDEERLILGSWCVKCLESVTCWFESQLHKPDPQSVKTVAFLCLSVEGLKHRALIEAAARAAQFQAWPMVSAPLDWSADARGGYLKGHPGGSAVLVHGDRGTELSQEAFDALNRLQRTPWRVNRLIYEVQKELLSSTNIVGSFKSYERDSWMDQNFPRIDPRVWEDKESKEYKDARRLLNTAHDARVLAEKQRQIPQRILEVAARFVQFDRIYFPGFVDSRGRMYYSCDTLTPQGSDYQKALLEFAEGTPVTAENFGQIEREYLINLANTLDKKLPGLERKTSKLSFAARIDVMREYCKDLEFIVDEPLGSEARKIWTDASEPFLFLATLVEYVQVCIRKTQLTCHAPLALDATNSGSQILGGVLRDEKLCRFCNVTPSVDGQPEDMYGEVARFAQARWHSYWRDEEFERINANLQKKADKINKERESEGKPADYMPRIDHTVRLKPEDITRSITKRATMCSAYGASHGSKLKYIAEECVSAGFKNENRLGYVELLALTNAVIKGQDDAFPVLQKINQFFSTVGLLCLANNQEFVEWKTPTGTVIKQEYREPVTKSVRTFAMGGGNFHQFKDTGSDNPETRYDLLVGYGDVIESKTASALAANWTHSIDASVAVVAINSFDKPCAFIHDCLVARPGEAFEFQKNIQHAYHRCITANVFDMLAEQNNLTFDQIVNNIPDEKQFNFGEVNIEDCFKSDYIFS